MVQSRILGPPKREKVTVPTSFFSKKFGSTEEKYHDFFAMKFYLYPLDRLRDIYTE